MSVDTQTAPGPSEPTGHKRRNSGPELLEKKLRQNIRRLSEEIDELKLKEMLKKGSGGASETWWLIGAFVTFNHIVGIYAMFFYTVPKSIYIAVAVVSFFTAFGITGGYHRLWSHRAYDASLPLRIIYAILGTNAFQGSIKWWVLRHRLHHRYTDTDHDPYNSKRGFYFSHIGWMFEKPYYPRLKSVDASDLNADPVVRFQHKYIAPCLFVMGFVCPALLGQYLANDWLGGLLWIGFVGRLYVWHITWSINSFAHWMGDRLFCDSISARGNLICAFLTNGEGYHNFHHEFPRDYRNGVHWYDYDPTKWFIRLFYWTGLASNLHRASNNAILQSRVQVQENELARARAKLEWGPEDKELPEMTLQEFQDRVKAENLEWIMIRGFAINVSEFKEDHPGGAKVLQSMRGKDATAAFEGGMNNHSNSAKNLAALYRVARIVERDPSEPKYLEDK